MAFSQATITQVYPPQIRGGQVYLSWETSSAAGNWWQVYVNQQLAWTGLRRWTWVPIPSGPVRIDIGTVNSGEEYVSFAESLPGARKGGRSSPGSREHTRGSTWPASTSTAPSNPVV